MNRGIARDFLLPVTVLIALTALIALTGSDIALESRFYEPGKGWLYGDTNPWRFLYRFGIIPAYIMAFAGLATFVAGFFKAHLAACRKKALFLVLLVVLGPGLMVNVVFKDHWGRPRPRQIEAFDGTMKFHQVWEKGADNKGRSFPSGHASMAFYLFAPFFILRRSAPGRAGGFLVLGILYGLFMGIARMLQGGHFPSDIVWAGGMVYLVGMLLYHVLGLDRESDACTTNLTGAEH
jgi:membrane-associated PAP2 superfamily phosphatase